MHENDKIRFGFIGAGIMGSIHLQQFAAHPEVEITAVADLDPARRDAARENHGLRTVFDDGDALLRSAEVDAVVIATHNNDHARYAIAALDAGKHVLLEKPMATSTAEARAILDAEQRSTGKLLIGHHMRWQWPYAQAKQHALEGKFGNIYYVKAGWFRRKGIPAWGSRYTQDAYMKGGASVDIGVHMLDLAMDMLGQPEPVSVFGTTRSELGPRRIGLGSWGVRDMNGRFDVDDLAAGMVRLANGTMINLEVTWAAYTDAESNGPYLHLMGDQGGISIRNADGHWMTEAFDNAVDLPLAPPKSPADARTLIAAHFIDCIRGRAEPRVTGYSGYLNCAILEGLQRSSRERREITGLLATT